LALAQLHHSDPGFVDAVRRQVGRINSSSVFRTSQRRQKFLSYLVHETLAGRGDRLKAYTIALEVFDRPATFDAAVDPLVRIEAGRLRDKLREYYASEGRHDPISIALPKGSYAPQIEARDAQLSDIPASGDTAAAENPDAAPVIIAAAHSSQVSRSDLTRVWAPAVLVLLAIAVAGWFLGRPNTALSHAKPSIAVLPFDNIGDDPKWTRLSDGITEDAITDLSHSKDLVVIARNSTEVYRSKPVDARQVGRELGVKYVLEGSIQPIGDRVRVTAQLIETDAGTHVWSERYDRPLADIFAVQSEVTQRIAATLGGYEGAVAEAERRIIRRKPPATLSAFETYLLGLEAKHEVTGESLARAEQLFLKAIELDRQFARAYVALVDTYFYQIDLGLASSVEATIEKMKHAAEKAVSLDTNDGKTHYAMGLASLYQRKPEQAATEFARAEALAPSDADMLLSIAWSLPGLGQSQRAVELADRALALNPHYPDWYNQGLSYVFLFGEQFARSIQHRLLVKSPAAIDHAFLAIAYAYSGRTAEAQGAAAKVRLTDPAWTAEQYLSESGGFPEKEAGLFVNGARRSGLEPCVSADRILEMPDLVRVKSCDAERANKAG
jgi:TolB-like protein